MTRFRPRPRALPALMLACCLLPAAARARTGPPPVSASIPVSPLDTVPVLAFPPIDGPALIAEDVADAKAAPGPLRFALPIDMLATPRTDGAWEALDDGSRLWRLRFFVPGATDLNFGFTRAHLPEGATLHVIAENEAYVEGPYTAADDRAHDQIWTAVIPGDRAVIELHVPDGAPEPILELGRVGAGYRDLLHRAEQLFPKSGACNNDVVCPVGDPWRSEIDAVAVYSEAGAFACSGTMIMDVPRDFRSFFLTADHCGVRAGNAASVVVYWNFQTSTCAGARDGSLLENQSGTTFRSTTRGPDFCLLELDAPPDPRSHVYWAGWDRSGTIPPGSVGIHHPNTDEKAITFNTDPLRYGDSCIDNATNTHWWIDQYEDGTTEPGSSGSGLWDPSTHLLIGTLSGGNAACGVLDYDCYGRFDQDWNWGATPDARLRDWLDPAGTAAMSVAGSYAPATIVLAAERAADACSLAGAGDANGLIEPGESVDLVVDLLATGSFTAVVGDLASTTPGVTLLDARATWPDLSASRPLANRAPDFAFTVDPSVPCLSTLDFTLTIRAAEGGPFVRAFSLPVGRRFTPDVPKLIADNARSVSTLAIPQAVTLSDVNVRVQLTHSYIGDLRLELQSPAGTTVSLFDRPGVPGSRNGCADADLDAVFDDSGTVDPETRCAGTSPWLTGVAKPSGALSAFAGESSTGTWTLIATDLSQNDAGVISGWELQTTPPLTGTCTPCAAASCPGQQMAISTVRVAKGATGSVVLTFSPPVSACALGAQVRMAPTAKPATRPGSFPTDPTFANVTAQDLDGGAAFRHVPPAGTQYYLVVENLAADGSSWGPSGSYGR